jgi:glycogen synthase
LLVPVENPSALAAAIVRLLGDAELRLKLAAGGLKRAGDFSAESMTMQYAEIFREVFNENTDHQ